MKEHCAYQYNEWATTIFQWTLSYTMERIKHIIKIISKHGLRQFT